MLWCETGPAKATPLTVAEVFQSAPWVARHFARGVRPPFSFVYGGKNSADFITAWNYAALTVSVTPDKEVTRFTYTDPATALTVRCAVTAFKDFPAVEWMLNFANAGGRDTPVIEKVRVIDHEFVTASGELILHHARGSDARRDDFAPLDDPIPAGKNIYLTPNGGRSSDGAALPFFNLEAPGGTGLVVAVGWTGKWCADVERRADTACTLSAGMERMALTLRPGEEIRAPRICFLRWRGGRLDGHNQFRRLVLAHYARMIDGRYAEYPLSGSFDFGDPPPVGEYEGLTEKYAVGLVERYQYFGILPEVFWLDAGWYAGCGLRQPGQPSGSWWANVGNWTAALERFPNGLRAIADAAHQAGAKFMVWFEPERARPGTQLDRAHPEWLVKLPGNDNYLFNLGNPDARRWLIDYMTEFIRREGIDYYRQDCNFDPYPYWAAQDAADGAHRVGMAEIRHVEGLYAYWDALLERFPRLLIDNCAAGGRRLDLETVARSAPLWRTDYQPGEPKGQQCHAYGLHFYLPQHGTATGSTDHYLFRSALGATMAASWKVTAKGSGSILEMQQRLRESRQLRPYFCGDYYPLTVAENHAADDVWLAMQFNRPARRDGIILAFRREQNNSGSLTVRLSGLADDVTYELCDQDQEVRVKKSGEELRTGLTLAIPQAPGSLLICYRAGE
ncbi:MAG: alpha-galactosidase [Verrucomicrobiales bacterium]|jgi:alpha-galactosidase|nr:alpha-galactosidase [Verrucomicrobiales bacterium]